MEVPRRHTNHLMLKATGFLVFGWVPVEGSHLPVSESGTGLACVGRETFWTGAGRVKVIPTSQKLPTHIMGSQKGCARRSHRDPIVLRTPSNSLAWPTSMMWTH